MSQRQEVHQQQCVLYSASTEDTLPWPQQGSILPPPPPSTSSFHPLSTSSLHPLLPPPPPYHQALRSLDVEEWWVTCGQDLAMYLDEPDGAPSSCPSPSSAGVCSVVEPSDGPTSLLHTDLTPLSARWSAFSPTALRQSVSLLPSPSRPHSNPGEVPCWSLPSAGHSHGEDSLYANPEAMTSSAQDFQDLSPAPPLTSRPHSAVSVLSDREFDDLAAGGFFVEGPSGDGGHGEDQVEMTGKGPAPGGGVGEVGEGKREVQQTAAFGGHPADGAQDTLLEDRRRLLQDVTVTATDEELLACARRMVETDDHSLLTKIMLKTKLQLMYVSRGEAVPDTSPTTTTQTPPQLRPEEEEKMDRRKKNGRASARTYRAKMKRLKDEKEKVEAGLQQRNVELRSQVQWLQDKIDTLRRQALSLGLLTTTTTQATPSPASTANTASATAPPIPACAGSSLSAWPEAASALAWGDRSRHCDVALFPHTPPPR